MKLIPYSRTTFLIFSIFLCFGSCKSGSDYKQLEELQSLKKYAAGVYSGGGASVICVLETVEAMQLDQEFAISSISPIDIQKGKLDSLDVLIFPGGSGSKEYLSLGQSGVQKVREFARKEGKGLVGICAGGYLFATMEGYPSLQLLNAGTFRDHYDRGRGLIAFDLNDKGKEIFHELSAHDTLFLQYYDGPIYRIPQNAPPLVLGTIISDIAIRTGYPKYLTPGKPSFLTASFGEGKIMVTVGHPESTPGMRWLVPRMARYVIDAPLVTYDSTVIRPDINQKEILYLSDIIALENNSRWGLYSDQDSIVLASLKNLHSIRSRPSIRWSTGLLRHRASSVRIAAALYLMESEYTSAIPELASAARFEENPRVQAVLEEVIGKLSEMKGNNRTP
ncbi:MAG: BPL-N domain-containing protein [Bacteroidota bacterium]|nr:BPL-N domain-containing protein [Bacteroidota bacterium]